jgi:very-short-patch-repair endonuclease
MEMNNDMSKYTRNFEELETVFVKSQKENIIRFIKKNFKENIHYIKFKNNIKNNIRGGHNKINYLFTEETFELIKNTFNLKHRYITKINDTTHVNVIMMSLENQTIGFIENSYKNVINVVRQYKFGEYFVDLYFPYYKLVIECDELNHEDRNEIYEREREEYISGLGNTFIRFNPNNILFDLSIVINNINKILFKNKT